MSPLSAGVSVCGVGERTERPLSGLPNRQQPDPDRAQDNRHGGDGGGVRCKRTSCVGLSQFQYQRRD